MVLTLKAKEGFEDDANGFQVGQTGLIGNPAAAAALKDADTLLLLGTDFPYRDWYPTGRTVIQVDTDATHIGRRAGRRRARGHTGVTVRDLLDHLACPPPAQTGHATARTWPRPVNGSSSGAPVRRGGRSRARHGSGRPRPLRPGQPQPRCVRPEALAALVDRLAAEDAVFTSDTGMASMAVAVRADARSASMIGSYNLGSMANAMPRPWRTVPGRDRQVVAFCGDGGLSMLLGDLMTLKTYRLPVKLVVFDNRRLGMVKLEQEQAGLPEFGTVLDNPDFAAVADAMGIAGMRDPRGRAGGRRTSSFRHSRPVLLDVLTNPDEIAVPAKPTVEQGWGFAVAKVKEVLRSHTDPQEEGH